MDGSTANLLRRFLQRAPDALTDEELLTLLLHAGTGAEEPRTLAARLIGQFGSLGAALSASPEELASVEGMDASRALLLRLVTELHRRYYLSRPFSGARLTGTTDFGNFLLPFFYGAREELLAANAVATAEGTRYTFRPPASMTAFTMARSSTPVMLPGTHTSTRERKRLKLVTRRMNSRSISQVMS